MSRSRREATCASADRVDAVQGFAPVYDRRARVLILGSMPGVRSLQAQEYYAHPHNAFWPILGELVGAGRELPYRARTAALRAAGVALWDVLHRCVRPGSLDADIDRDSIEPNDFAWLFGRCPRIAAVFCNGGTAYDSYRRRVLPALPAPLAALPLVRLPSTSPAHAALRPADKLARWRRALLPALAE